jgi:hypothetical protein
MSEQRTEEPGWITSACPSCGTVAQRESYDMGSGPELACADCEWCWGADGQRLKALPFAFTEEPEPQTELPRYTRQQHLVYATTIDRGVPWWVAVEAASKSAEDNPEWDMEETFTFAEWHQLEEASG